MLARREGKRERRIKMAEAAAREACPVTCFQRVQDPKMGNTAIEQRPSLYA